MLETISVTYKHGVLVPTKALDLPEQAPLQVQVVPATVHITAATARRKVNRFLLDEVSYLMGAELPTLEQKEYLVWRVPITLSYPNRGIVGEIGHIDVLADTGDLLTTATTAQDLQDNARTLLENPPV